MSHHDVPEKTDLHDIELVPVYAAAGMLEADRVVALLADEDIEAHKQAVTVTSFPTLSGSQHLIIVAGGHAASAKALIGQAIEDRVLSDGGAFL